jgi:hypothetical protein
MGGVKIRTLIVTVGGHQAGFEFYGDATGRARTTAAAALHKLIT